MPSELNLNLVALEADKKKNNRAKKKLMWAKDRATPT